jgi:DNA-binding MarR family transcriptional regulator
MEIQRAKAGVVDSPELADDLGAVLARLYGFLRRAILPREMSLTQALALGTLRDLGPQRVTDLAGIEGVRQPTCTGLVNTMEAQGWVVRTVDQTDRRAVVVELTPAGRAILEGITKARATVLGRYLDALSDDEREGLAAALPSLKKLIELGTEGEGVEFRSEKTTT